MGKILIADDEKNIVDLIEYNLQEEGFKTVKAFNGLEAREMIERGDIDLALLDVMMPKIDGYQLLKDIRAEQYNIPVILITARSEEFDKVLGLNLGADDYIVKPFGIQELIARVKAQLRRTLEYSDGSKEEKKDILVLGELKLDLQKYQVYLQNEKLNLTTREFELLKKMVSEKGKVFSREDLLESLWGYEYIGESRTVDVHIRHLREKIEKDPANPEYIKTVRGFGYKAGE